MTALLPLDTLGAREVTPGVIAFGVLFPWVSAADGNRVSVKVIHERDQLLSAVAPREFPLAHGIHPTYGDYWSTTVPIAGAAPGSSWGQPGTYLYWYCVTSPDVGVVDHILDPVAREFGAGKQSAFTLGYQHHTWSAGEAGWRTPALADLVMYELDIAELAGDLRRAAARMPYLADLGVNCIEVMPLSNVSIVVDWGYLPVGYFGVDERFGDSRDFQALVDAAHANGIAVVVDMVYGHTGVGFPYHELYTRLGYAENPFMGAFGERDYFSRFGKSTDFTRALTRDYFHTVTHRWLDTFHVDGIRYDCVPNFWDGPYGNGYANVVFSAHELVAQQIAAGAPYWARFDGGGGEIRLINCAEQLERPVEMLATTYSSCTWQNATFDAARRAASGDRGALADLGRTLGLLGYPEQVMLDGTLHPRTALQYIENHDHERFICNFGLRVTDEDNNPLFLEGDRARWFEVQPYLIALLLAKGIPLLWEGQELCENYFLPERGDGRTALLRPVRWDYFYDDAGQGTLRLVRRLLAVRKAGVQFRRGEHHFHDSWDRYQSHGVLVYARWTAQEYSVVMVNTSRRDQRVPFWFSYAGDYREELVGGAADLTNVIAGVETWVDVPASYGRVWTAT